MRAVLFLMVILLARPAAAQLLPRPTAPESFELWQRQEELRQQQIVQENRLMALEARLRAQQGVLDLQTQLQTPRLREPSPGARPPPNIDVSRLASIPDAALAASNARVLQAARNRR